MDYLGLTDQIEFYKTQAIDFLAELPWEYTSKAAVDVLEGYTGTSP